MGYTELKVNHKSEKKMFYIALLLIGLLIIFLLFYMNNALFNQTVFTLNGEKVSKEEFYKEMASLSANVYSDFAQKYRDTESTKFWTTNFKGEIPLEVLKEKTLEELIRIKAEQILFNKYGLMADTSYSAFRKALEAENKRREIAISKGEPIYGPVHYDERIYYDYLHGNRRAELKRILSKTDLSVTEEQIDEKYSEMVDKMVEGAKLEINKKIYEDITF